MAVLCYLEQKKKNSPRTLVTVARALFVFWHLSMKEFCHEDLEARVGFGVHSDDKSKKWHSMLAGVGSGPSSNW